MQSAAGGTIQRLKPGAATVRLRDSQPPLSLALADVVLDMVAPPLGGLIMARTIDFFGTEDNRPLV